jgi:hypothetical protein
MKHRQDHHHHHHRDCHPCLELGDSLEHRLLAWMTFKSNRAGLLPMGFDRFLDRAGRDLGHSPDEIKVALLHLLDGGFTQKVKLDR